MELVATAFILYNHRYPCVRAPVCLYVSVSVCVSHRVTKSNRVKLSLPFSWKTGRAGCNHHSANSLHFYRDTTADVQWRTCIGNGAQAKP